MCSGVVQCTLFAVEMLKKCTPLWREAHFEVKMRKAHQVRTTFSTWDVEKVHAVVARSTFRSQNVQNTPCTDHFWRFRCRKSARSCGAKHISKSKCTKHTMYGPFLQVQKSFRVSHYTPIHYTTLQLQLQLHFTTFYYTTLHYATLHSIALNYTQLHYSTLHYTPLHYTTLHYTTLHYTTLHFTYTYSYTPLHEITLHWCVLCILTWKCASRHNGVHFFDIATSKSGPTLRCFVHFDFEMCFAPQRRANFHLWSGQLAPHPPLWRAYFSTLRSHKSLAKQSVSRLSYLFAHLHLLSSDSFSSDLLSSNLSLLSASALLCF